MKVTLEKRSGKQWGIYFEGENPELYDRIKSFINHHMMWLGAPYRKQVKEASPFIQSDHHDFLFIEFWSAEDKWQPFVDLLVKEFSLLVDRKKVDVIKSIKLLQDKDDRYTDEGPDREEGDR